eukprot:5195720-Prymnesium_polylepis.1
MVRRVAVAGATRALRLVCGSPVFVPYAQTDGHGSRQLVEAFTACATWPDQGMWQPLLQLFVFGQL